jgi:hypothetical protein
VATSPVNLPPGFVLRSQPQNSTANLPPGFVLRQQSSEAEREMSLGSKILGTKPNEDPRSFRSKATGYVDATLEGLGNVAEGGKQFVGGRWDMVKSVAKPPESFGEAVMPAPVRVLRPMIKGTADSINQARELPDLIRQVNEMPDAGMHHLDVIGKSAGNAAGQILTGEALGVGVPRGWNKANQAVEAFRAPSKAVKATAQEAATVRSATAAEVQAAKQQASSTVTAADKSLSKAKVAHVQAIENTVKTATESLPTRMREHVVTNLREVAKRDGLPDLKSITVRESVPELATNLETRATAAYQSVDKALGGQLQPLRDAIRDTNHSISANKVLDPIKAEALTKRLAELNRQKAAAIKKAQASGITNADTLIRTADRDYARAKALEKVNKKFASASGAVRHGGEPNAARFATVVDELNNSGTLKFALGEEQAAKLVKATAEHLEKTKQAKLARSAATKAESDLKSQSTWRESVSRDAERSVEKAEQAAEKKVQEADKAHEAAKERLSNRNKKLTKIGVGALGGGYALTKGKQVKDALFGE